MYGIAASIPCCKRSQIANLLVNYGISNTIVMKMPYIAFKSAICQNILRLIQLWCVTRDELRTRATLISNIVFFKTFHTDHYSIPTNMIYYVQRVSSQP